MSKLLEQYDNILNLKYHKTLKKVLTKQHNNKYNSFLENITSEELLTESEIPFEPEYCSNCGKIIVDVPTSGYRK